MKFQIPNFKFQKDSKLQSANPQARVWNLRMGVFLELGAWNLEFFS